MNLSLWAIICSIMVSSITIALAGENANLKKNNPKNTMDEDLTIDDDDVEGSGFHEGRYDLESSGSGYGPDDEDAEREPFVTRTKPNKSRGHSPVTIPIPSSKSSSTSTTPMLPKRLTEPPLEFDENSGRKQVESVSNENKNTDVQSNNNLDRVENVNHNSDLSTKKLDEENVFDANAHPDEKNLPEEDSKNVGNGGVYKVNTSDRDRASSFFAQPGILVAVIGGAVVGLLCAILVVMFIVYRMRKKDEGSYPLEEMKRCPANNPYMKPNHREFFA